MNQSEEFDAWFESAHTCEISSGYCYTHDDIVVRGRTFCMYANQDPLLDPHDIMVEDAMIDEDEFGG